MPSPETDLLDLQERLRADATGHERKRLQELLAQFRRDIAQHIDKGVRPPEFEGLRRLAEATEAGERILLTTWRGYHPGAAV